MPKKSLLPNNSNNKGLKEKGERLTVLLCVSKSGLKRNPLFIGKSLNPRVFKNINMKDLEIDYHSNKRAWMNRDIFSKWLEKFNFDMKMEKRA